MKNKYVVIAGILGSLIVACDNSTNSGVDKPSPDLEYCNIQYEKLCSEADTTMYIMVESGNNCHTEGLCIKKGD